MDRMDRISSVTEKFQIDVLLIYIYIYIYIYIQRFTSQHNTQHGRRRGERPQQAWKNQETDFARSSNMEEDMAEDRHLWRLGVDGRLLAV